MSEVQGGALELAKCQVQELRPAEAKCQVQEGALVLTKCQVQDEAGAAELSDMRR